jgi:hypothetical protein
MHVLVPYYSCVVTEHEFEEAKQQGFPNIYITSAKGIMHHAQLAGERFVRLKVDEIPGYKEAAFDEANNFLPAGRIPQKFLFEIIQFFRDVMNIKKAEQEAMAHILWNEVEGYHIAIPDQVVSKASVRYENNHIKPNDTIVLDIHSHNTMGAFFSGTDDNDDRIAIGYSGVVGELNKASPALKFRFNLNKVKREAQLDEIFDFPKLNSQTPVQWLDKVKTGSQVYTKGTAAGTKGELVVVRNARGDTHSLEVVREGKSWPPREAYSRALERGRKVEVEGRAGRANPSSIERDLFSHIEGLGDDEPAFGHFYKADEGSPILTPQDLKALGVEDSVRDSHGSFLNKMHEMDEADQYAEHACNYGTEAADAMEQIGIYILDLQEEDKLLLEIIHQAYDLMSEEGQARFQTNGL